MENNNEIQLFEHRTIRTAWDENQEEWYFSIVDVIAVLTDQKTQRSASTYWAVLKKRLKDEGADQLLTNCKQLKLKSPKAEPFKLWLAQVGRERMEETIDPELSIDRALETYARKGYSKEWINQRLQAIQVRKELTEEWKERGIRQGSEFAILTDEITRAWSGMSTREYKNLKGLKKENLRDNMTTTEIILNMLAETATKDISRQAMPASFEESRQVAKRGGRIAGNARKEQPYLPNT